MYDGSEGNAHADVTTFRAEITGDDSNRGVLMVDFNGAHQNKIIRGYFEVSFAALKDDIFLEFIGNGKKNDDASQSTTKYNIFCLGTDNTGKYKGKANDSRDVLDSNLFNPTAPAIEAEKTYEIGYEIDTIAKTIGVQVNGVGVIEYDYSSNTNFEGVNKVKIESPKNTNKVYVNNIILDIKETSVDAARNTAKETVSAFTENAKYQYAKTAIDNIISKYNAPDTGLFAGATTVSAIADLLDDAKDELATAIANVNVTIKYYIAQFTEVASPDVANIATYYEQGTGNVYTLTTDTEIDTDKTYYTLTSYSQDTDKLANETKSTELGKVYTKDDLKKSGYSVDELYTSETFDNDHKYTSTNATTDATGQVVYVAVRKSDAITTTYTFDWSKILPELTTTAYYYTSRVSTDSEADRAKDDNDQYIKCYDNLVLDTAKIQPAFVATVDGNVVSTTPIITIDSSGAQVNYRDGVRGKDETETDKFTYGQKVHQLNKDAANNTKSVEIKNGKKGFTFTFTGTGTITIDCCSTGSSNNSWFALKKGDTKLTASAKDDAFTIDNTTTGADGYYQIGGSTSKTITFTITEPGTYTLYVGNPSGGSNVKPLRVFGVTVVENA